MTIDTMLLGTGVFALILPSLGFPSSIDDVLFRIVGLIVIVLAIAVRRGGLRTPRAPKQQGFEESRPLVKASDSGENVMRS